MVELRHFKKAFGAKLIVAAEDISLAAPCYWLKGGNGSGKTTLLHAIAGMIPFDGDILVAGKNIRSASIAYRLAVNYAAAEPAYPEFLTGRDLISFYTEAKKGTSQQAEKLISALGISDFIGDKIGTYSSGMAKKLSLVLAFIGKPELLLLDEPLITLDVAAVAVLLELIADALQDGVQCIITSHQDIPAGFSASPKYLSIRDRQLIAGL